MIIQHYFYKRWGVHFFEGPLGAATSSSVESWLLLNRQNFQLPLGDFHSFGILRVGKLKKTSLGKFWVPIEKTSPSFIFFRYLQIEKIDQMSNSRDFTLQGVGGGLSWVYFGYLAWQGSLIRLGHDLLVYFSIYFDSNVFGSEFVSKILPCDFCTAEVFFQQCQLLVASDSEFSMAIPDKIKQGCKI